jgi:hypothetical protein
MVFVITRDGDCAAWQNHACPEIRRRDKYFHFGILQTARASSRFNTTRFPFDSQTPRNSSLCLLRNGLFQNMQQPSLEP